MFTPLPTIVITCDVVRDEVDYFVRQLSHIVHVEILQQGLHNDPPKLRTELQKAIDKVETEVPQGRAIVLGYGLCSRGVEGVTTKRCKLVMARAHDCITLLLGSKERYAQYVMEHPGTYWYSPGWNRCHTPPGPQRYEKLLNQYREKFGEEDAEFLMETEQAWFKTYERATYVDLGPGATDTDIKYTKDCADWLGWSFDAQKGSPSLLQDLLAGRWDNERFLVLEPGQTPTMTADEQIVTAMTVNGKELKVQDDATEDNSVRLNVEADGQHHVFVPTDNEQNSVISDLLRRGGLPLNTRCGGKGLCDGCLVDVTRGEVVHVHSNQPVTGGTEAPRSIQACQHRLAGEQASVRVPERSSLKHQPQIVSDYQICISAAHDPLYREIRLAEVDDPGSVAVHVERDYPGLPVRISPFITIPPNSGPLYLGLEHRGDHRLVSRISNTPATRILGAAIDIGTTTVALMLVDLRDGNVIARASRFNRQMNLGDDVLTRINLCSTDPKMLGELQDAVTHRTILPLLERALGEVGADLTDVRCLCLAGNTTMLHLLAGVDPTSLGVAPFTPVFLEHRVISAAEIFLDDSVRHITCHLLPGASAYVGADLTAGVIATGMEYDEGPCLLVDVGTNGEIVLKNKDQMLGCSTAAGPAFEGARLSSGMRAADGSISHIRFDNDTIDIEVIGDVKPIGICGSAYVDFLAHAHAAGIVTDTGRFETSSTHSAIKQLMPHNGDTVLRLAYATGKQPIVVSQHDIASLLQAKAAIAAGIITLLEQQSLKPSDIKTVYLAGGFGTHLNRRAAIACGMLPGFTYEQVKPVGNTSLAGAYLSLMDAGLLAEISRAAVKVRPVELNLDPEFETRFIDQLSLAPMI